MKNKEIVGIDVSKNTLDVYILSNNYHLTVKNAPEGFACLIETTISHVKREIPSSFLLLGEYRQIQQTPKCLP